MASRKEYKKNDGGKNKITDNAQHEIRVKHAMNEALKNKKEGSLKINHSKGGIRGFELTTKRGRGRLKAY